MVSIGQAFSDLIGSIVGAIIMLILSVITFYITVFVVATGASMAGYDPSGDFVVLAAALLVVAAIMSGGLAPGRSGE